MNIVRLTKVNEVVHLWPFLSNGILRESRYLKYDLTLDTYRKILFRLVKSEYTAWVAVAFDDDKTPIGFIVAHECTPLFAKVREFEISIFYYLFDSKSRERSDYLGQALTKLQQSFDNFCRANDIKRYFVTTTRKCGSADRVFGDEWTGLKRAYTVFKKNIT